MNKKLLVVGIDGIEPTLVNKLLSTGRSKGFVLFSASRKYSALLESTFPPDTNIAWPSIYTGINPYKLRLNESSQTLMNKRAYDMLNGRTFWDYASHKQFTCCIINPVPIFPSWQINGTMITARENSVSASPGSIQEDYAIPTMSYAEDYPAAPGEHRKRFQEIMSDTWKLHDFATQLLCEEGYDLFFVLFETLDHAQHYLWRFTDTSDPTTPILNVYGDYVMKLYEIFDRIVSAFIETFGEEYTIVVLGDHGHGRRPWKLFSLNELMRRAGLLHPDNASIRFKLMSLIKALGLEFTYYSFTDWIAYKAYSHLQKKRPMITLTNVSSSTAIATRGAFGKQYGQITIQEPTVERRQRTADMVANFLSGIDIIDSVVKTNEVYGRVLDSSQPDLLIKLKDEYGFQHGIFVPLIQRNFERRIISGGHLPNTILMLWPGPSKCELVPSTRLSAVDFAPSVLRHFNIDIPSELEGQAAWRSDSET